MADYSETQKAKDIRDLEYLMTCRQFLHNSVEKRQTLDKELNRRDSKNDLVFEKGSREREALEGERAKVQTMEDSLRQKLSKDYRINDGVQLSQRIKSIQSKYPDYEDKVAEIRKQYAAQQQGQSNQGQTPTPGEEKGTDYDQLYGQSPDDVKGKKQEPIQKDGYDSLYDKKPDMTVCTIRSRTMTINRKSRNGMGLTVTGKTGKTGNANA